MRRLSAIASLGMVFLAVPWSASGAAAWLGSLSCSTSVVDRVEEDWELVIGQPDLTAEGPQITTIMSTTDDLSGQFVAFNLNYRGQPDYQPGGLEVVGYMGKEVQTSSNQETHQLETADETVTWTQRMQISSGTVQYDITQGESTTWGQFGQGEGSNLRLSLSSTTTDLSGYRPEASIRYSGAGWQPNRVTSMRIKQIRYYSEGNLIALDPTPREIDLDGEE
jgi:hypothetical protein